MRISLLQFAPVWLNPEANLHLIQEHCGHLLGASDMLILPEMFNTGYVLDTSLLQFRWQAETIVRLQELADTFRICFGGSIPMFRQGKWYNTFIFVDKDGLKFHYDKIQLFSLAGEKDHYTSGKSTSLFQYKGFSILPLICYDLRFPYLSFDAKIPDLIIYSANWPVSRIDHWKSLITARAIENLCYVAGVNRIGHDHNGFEYPGDSRVIDYNGHTIATSNATNGVVTVALDKAAMEYKRERYGFLKDRMF
ncbi:MAG: hypothetical protein LC107_13025 [Chitinophagales bacterium]|nr:hypothetical protein [Chitinophagales bacterium]